MKKRGNIQKLTSFFLVFVMLLGVFMPTQTVFAEGLERVDTQITDFSVTTSSGEIPPDGFSLSNALRIGISWDASVYQNNLKEGDYFNVNLPKEFIFPEDHSACNFDIKTPDGTDVVARAAVTPDATNGGGIIKVTFTKYVEDKYHIKGSMFLNATFNKKYIKTGQENVIAIAIGSQIVPIVINVKPINNNPLNEETLSKWSRNKLFAGYVRWEARINHKKGNLTNVVITDELSSEDGDLTGIHYKKDSFRLMEINADAQGNVSSHGPIIDISNNVIFSDNDTKFRYELGNISGKQYFISYDTTFKENIKLRNKITLINVDETWTSSSSAVFAESGGQGSGDLLSKIKIIKVDSEDNEIKLAGAIFEVTRLSDNTTFTLTTNSEGEILSDKLIPGKYKIKETTQPVGYILNDETFEVDVKADGACIKTIKNQPVKTNITVEKRWIGATGSPVTAILKADGTEVARHELTEATSWTHTFEKLRKYQPGTDTEIVYTVEEETIPQGYTVSYETDPTGVLVIKNTQDKTKVKVTKEWEDVTGNRPAIKLQLLKNGQNEGSPIELTNGTTTHTWTDLDKTDAQGNEYIYTVKEVGETANSIQLEGNWYKVSYGGNTQDGLTVINKKLSPWTPMIPPTRDVKVTKEWKDISGNNMNEAPVEKIEVELYKDGVATGKKLELRKDNNWIGEFKNLEVADGLGSTNYYQYTVKEIGETTGSIKLDGKWFKVSYSGSMKDGFTITNQKEKPWTPMDPLIREVKVTKLWKDHKGNTITAPTEKITVELYKDGNPTGKTLELNTGNNWSGVFKIFALADGLGSTDYYKYTVKEVGEDGNAVKFDGKQYKVVYGGSMKDGLTITNEKETLPVPPTPPNTEKPKVPNTSINNSLPKTGDEANLSLYAWLMFASGSLLILLGIRKRKHAK